MTAFNAVYRASVYDETDSTIMVPVSGSHSNNFSIATATGIGSYQPYMGIPKGSKSSVTLPLAQVTVGQMNVNILDKRLTEGGSNYIRWASAFLGDINKRFRLIGRKMFIEESIDGGSTFTPYFVGRIVSITLPTANEYQFTISDSVEDMKRNIFLTSPNIPTINEGGYLVKEYLLPFGLSDPMWDFPAVEWLSASPQPGSISTLTKSALMLVNNYTTASNAVSTAFRTLNPATNQLVARPNPGNDENAADNATTLVNVINQTHASSGQFTLGNAITIQDSSDNTIDHMLKFQVFEKASNAQNYLPITSLHDGDVVSFAMENPSTRGGSNNQKLQGNIYLYNVHPVQIIKDMFDGKYFASTSTASIQIPYDSTVSTLLADKTIPNATFRIQQSMTMVDFIEKNIMQPYQLGYCTVPSSDATSKIHLFKTATPTGSIGTVIGQDDIVADQQIKWTTGIPYSQITFIGYEDSTNATALSQNTNYESTIISNPDPQIWLNPDSYITPNTWTIDGLGVRSSTVTSSLVPGATGSFTAEAATALQLFFPIAKRWGDGVPSLSLKCRRTSTITSLTVGDWVLVEVDKQPNQALNQRGGERLMQVVGKTEMGSVVNVDLIDGALNTVAPSPTIGSMEDGDDPVFNAALLPITASNFGGTVHYQVAITAGGEGTPSGDDTRWHTAGFYHVVSGSVLGIANGIGTGVRTYGRARTEDLDGVGVVLASPWVVASNYLDFDFLNPPSALAINNITAKSALATWVTGSAGIDLELFIASPWTGSYQRAAFLLAGTTKYQFTGLDLLPSPSCSVALRHNNLIGGVSAAVTGTFIAINPPNQASPPQFLEIFIGD